MRSVFNNKVLALVLALFVILALSATFTQLYADHGGSGSGSGGSGSGGGGGETGGGGGNRPLGTLKGVPIPQPDLTGFVNDQAALVALGKALFWDMQTGSDGVQACATCHFNAGADSRSKNTINPRNTNVFQVGGAPNYQLQAADFPFHKLSNPQQQSSLPISDSSNVVGSQGTFFTQFVDVVLGKAKDARSYVAPDVYSVNGIKTRRVTGRNTPSNINAVFNYRNFWDGRAQNEFNGNNPFGDRDANANVLVNIGGLFPVHISLPNSSLASQAVGPPNNGVEMAYDGPNGISRNWKKLGKKMLSLPVPLAGQKVAIDDSVLAAYSRYPIAGLNTTYVALIQRAFQPQWWSDTTDYVDGNGNFAPGVSTTDTNYYNQMEYNFSMFWGLAIQAYEATLVSDNTPFDQFMAGNRAAMSSLAQQGLNIFTGKGHCADCHNGPEFTDAAVSAIQSRGVIERVNAANGGSYVRDTGFRNLGVRLTSDDPGQAGGDGITGAPLSVAQMASDGTSIYPTNLIVAPGERVGSHGAVKTPGLRNVELTAPYFHNGGEKSLTDVINFYSRGGNFFSQNIADVDVQLQPRGFSASDTQALVAFLQALTDPRVRNQSAPFDHPELSVPLGHPGNQFSVTDDLTGFSNATTTMFHIPATGQSGGTPFKKFCLSLGGATAAACQ
jgi:cytochrome c peroxidase